MTNAYADTAPTATTASTGTPAGLPPGAGPQQPGLASMLLPFALMIGVFYFFMIRPQQKKMKEHETLLSSVQKGEEVITQAGIFGKVTGITEKVLTLEIANNVQIKILKSQVATVLRGEQKIV